MPVTSRRKTQTEQLSAKKGAVKSKEIPKIDSEANGKMTKKRASVQKSSKATVSRSVRGSRQTAVVPKEEPITKNNGSATADTDEDQKLSSANTKPALKGKNSRGKNNSNGVKKESETSNPTGKTTNGEEKMESSSDHQESASTSKETKQDSGKEVSKKPGPKPKAAATKATTSKRGAKKDQAPDDEPPAKKMHISEPGEGTSSGTSPGPKKGATKRKAAPKAVDSKKLKVVQVLPRHTRGVGQVLSVGQGDVGQLGLGPDIMEKSRLALVNLSEPIVDVRAGGMHTVCLSQTSKLYSFGCNDEGALGRNTSDEEGSEFTPGLVELPGPVADVSAGDSHTAALLEDGRVFAWGTFRDSSGTMGLTPSGVTHTPIQLLSGIPVVKIASGGDHLVMLTIDGDLYTCGNAEHGELGRVSEVFAARGGRKGVGYVLSPGLVHLKKQRGGTVKFENIWAGFYSTFAKAKDSNLIYAFGLNNYNQLGIDDLRIQYMPFVAKSFTGKNWVHISPGQHHTVALDSEGIVHVLGRREYGRLGLGSNCTDQTVPTQVPDLATEECVEVAAGISASYAVSASGKVFAWGAGSEGSLGTGDEEDHWSPVPMASKLLDTRQAIACSSGGQHAVILAKEK